jgi:hypothetical protein
MVACGMVMSGNDDVIKEAIVFHSVSASDFRRMIKKSSAMGI